MTENNPFIPATKIVTGKESQNSASLFNYGNIIAILIPFPLLIFWFGASIIVYSMNRHHPNPKVFYYLRRAGNRFYFIMGFFIVIGTYFKDWKPVAIYWLIALIILIPSSIWDLYKIRKDTWEDFEIKEKH